MKVKANIALCSRHARCAVVAPEVFCLDDDGFMGFSEKEIPAESLEKARRSVDACPERALTLVED